MPKRTRGQPFWPVCLPAVLLLVMLGFSAAARAEPGPHAFTLYAGKMSAEEGWEDVLINPVASDYADSWLFVAALSTEYLHYREGRVAIGAEAQVGYNSGDQDYWEYNLVPVMPRWKDLFMKDRLATSIAFGLGLSYTSDLSEIEYELEGDTSQLLVYWVLELTAGPRSAPWSASLRLHHRSVAYGLMGEDGGMNAVGLGLRWQF
jgi:hypothetical protein